MSFIVPTFLFVFLPLALALYHFTALITRGCRCHAGVTNFVLFTISVFFYTWGEVFHVLVLGLSLVVNYSLARWAEERGTRTMRPVLAVALGFNLGLLVYFKYSKFLVDNLSVVFELFGLRPLSMNDPHLPLGISFFTFQSLSYVIDVCRRSIPAERGLIRYGVYVFLFPHLFAGPIVRYAHLVDQLGVRVVRISDFAEGVRRFVLGLSKKILLAETFGEVADAVFQAPVSELSAGTAWLGAICFTLKIYFDFSGYSDMAIGLARMFGFTFHENFNFPYIAGSITDFWRRWHISLSSWFRDYLYIPLGGNRFGNLRTYRNLLIVFILCGFWHGANWTFLLWGLWHGLFLILERLGLGNWLERLGGLVRHTYTLLVVILGWVLFRATSLEQAAGFGQALLGLGTGVISTAEVWINQLYLFGPIGILACLPPQHLPGVRKLEPVMVYLLPGILAGLMILNGMHLAAKTFTPFIYFRF